MEMILRPFRLIYKKNAVNLYPRFKEGVFYSLLPFFFMGTASAVP